MFISETKQNELKEMFILAARDHVSAISAYDVVFEEAGGNVNVKFTVFNPVTGKELFYIQNVMTPGGFKDLDNRRAWMEWTIQHCELMKKILERPKLNPIKRFFKRLFRKMKR